MAAHPKFSLKLKLNIKGLKYLCHRFIGSDFQEQICCVRNAKYCGINFGGGGGQFFLGGRGAIFVDSLDCLNFAGSWGRNPLTPTKGYMTI